MTQTDFRQSIESAILTIAEHVNIAPRPAVVSALRGLALTAFTAGLATLGAQLTALFVRAPNLSGSDLTTELVGLYRERGQWNAEAAMMERVPDAPQFETLAELIQSLGVKS